MKQFIVKQIGNIKKFSFGEMTSNINGKTSGSGTMGILICTIGALCFLLGAVDAAFLTHSTDIMLQSIIFVGIGVGLLGYRKSQKSKENVIEVDNKNDEENKDEIKPINSWVLRVFSY